MKGLGKLAQALNPLEQSAVNQAVKLGGGGSGTMRALWETAKMGGRAIQNPRYWKGARMAHERGTDRMVFKGIKSKPGDFAGRQAAYQRRGDIRTYSALAAGAGVAANLFYPDSTIAKASRIGAMGAGYAAGFPVARKFGGNAPAIWGWGGGAFLGGKITGLI